VQSADEILSVLGAPQVGRRGRRAKPHLDDPLVAVPRRLFLAVADLDSSRVVVAFADDLQATRAVLEVTEGIDPGELRAFCSGGG
jgi:hypothetical protein